MLDLASKIILVSKRMIDENGDEIFDTFFAKVISFNENTVRVKRLSEEKEDFLPYGEEFYQPADGGFYELDDGSTYSDPDWIAEFAVYKNEEVMDQFSDRSCA